MCTRVLLLTITGIAVVTFIACGGGGSTATQYGQPGNFRTELDAVKAAEKALKGVLKYPHDAEFVGYPKVTVTEAGYWRVLGQVKAMNEFGAKPTQLYVVSLSLDAATKTWTVEGVNLNNQFLFMTPEPARHASPPTRKFSPPPDATAEVAIRTKKIEDAKWRTWTSADGAFTTEAKYLRMIAGVATLEKRNGTVINVPLDKLVPEDVEFIRKQLWKKAAND